MDPRHRSAACAAGFAGALLLLSGCALFLANLPPIARIVATPLSGESPLVVAFDGSDSTDADGEITTYTWAFGDGEIDSGVETEHTYVVTDETTRFTVKLTVRDDKNAAGEAHQTIEVRPGTVPPGGEGDPIARIAVDRIAGAAPLEISFDGSASQPGAGAIAAHNWDFGDNAKGSGARVTHTYDPDATREFTATLYVWNDEGGVATAQVRILAIVPAAVPGDERPHAEFDASDPLLLYRSPSPATTPTLFELTFDPRASYADAGHRIDYYIWDFGDGSEWRIETSDLQVTHIYRLSVPSHVYVVRLFVYDDQGLEHIALLNVTLTQPAT